MSAICTAKTTARSKPRTGAVHYDVNDFDETTRGPFELDIYRLTTSLFLASRGRGDASLDSIRIALSCASEYAASARKMLKKGKGSELDVRESVPSGCEALDRLMQKSGAVKRAEFIAGLTERGEQHHTLRRSANYFNLPDSERETAQRLLADFRRRMPKAETPDYYEPEDVCGRVAGIGSMGRYRYAILIAGKSKKEGRNVLLEFKESLPSALDKSGRAVTDNAGRAEQVVAMLRRSQAASNAHIGFAVDKGMSFQVREIGPHDARLRAEELKSVDELEALARVQAGILARIHTRSANLGVGSANPLTEMQDEETFCLRVVGFALAYADLVQRDWVQFTGRRSQLDDTASWSKA